MTEDTTRGQKTRTDCIAIELRGPMDRYTVPEGTPTALDRDQ